MTRSSLIHFWLSLTVAAGIWGSGGGAAYGQGPPPTTGQNTGNLGELPTGPPTLPPLPPDPQETVDIGTMPPVDPTTPSVPDNNNYDNPVTLTTGVMVESSSEGATGEPGELSPPLTQTAQTHSLWFLWTATETGWHTGSVLLPQSVEYPNGYIAAWKDNGTGPPEFIHKAPLYKTFQLKAEAGQRYRICVAGETGDEGMASFHIGMTVSPEPPALEVTSFSLLEEALADGEVDTGSGPVRGTLRFGYRSAFDPVSWRLSFPGLDHLGFRFGDSRRVSGTAREGVCEVPFEIPGHLPPRRVYFHLLVMDQPEWPARWADCGFFAGAPIFSSGPPPSLLLGNTGAVDTDPPVLTRCASDKDTVDITGFPENWSFFIRTEFFFTVADTSGVAFMEALLIDEDGASAAYLTWDAADREAGTAAMTEFSGTDSFYGTDRPGLYYLRVTMLDWNGNRSVVRSTDPAGYPGPFAGLRVTGTRSGSMYPYWREEKFTGEGAAREEVSGETADPDGDGFPNFLEYALNLNPSARDADGWSPSVKPDEDYPSSLMEFRYTRAAGSREEVRYEVQRADTPSGPWTRAEPRGARRTLQGVGGERETRTEAVVLVFPTEGRAFFRLAVTK